MELTIQPFAVMRDITCLYFNQNVSLMPNLDLIIACTDCADDWDWGFDDWDWVFYYGGATAV